MLFVIGSIVIIGDSAGAGVGGADNVAGESEQRNSLTPMLERLLPSDAWSEQVEDSGRW